MDYKNLIENILWIQLEKFQGETNISKSDDEEDTQAKFMDYLNENLSLESLSSSEKDELGMLTANLISQWKYGVF